MYRGLGNIKSILYGESAHPLHLPIRMGGTVNYTVYKSKKVLSTQKSYTRLFKNARWPVHIGVITGRTWRQTYSDERRRFRSHNSSTRAAHITSDTAYFKDLDIHPIISILWCLYLLNIHWGHLNLLGMWWKTQTHYECLRQNVDKVSYDDKII